ncbi:hypothetical protein BH11MYX1_BH11MYX1_24830 [soil metagenome]
MLGIVRLLALVGVLGCGRIAFDPLAGDAAAPISDTFDDHLLLHFAFETDGLLHDRATGYDANCNTCATSGAGATSGTTAAQFDGTACLYVPAADLKPHVFTIALWEQQLAQQRSTIFGKPLHGATSYEDSFEIYTAAGSSDVSLLGADTTLSVSPQLAAWHHIAGVFDGATLTVYLDGSPQATMSGLSETDYADDAIQIGCDTDMGSEIGRFVGSIDDVRLYGRALSPSEIAVLASRAT